MHKMKFTALNITEGDSFLLETSEQVVLVDTGKEINGCRDQLTALNIKHIDLLLITHYDEDHVGGLLNLIKSSITIKEIFLPDNFGRINESLKNNALYLLRHIISIESLDKFDENENFKNEAILISVDPNHKNIIEVLLNVKPILKKRHIDLIKKIVDQCDVKKIKITWLKYTGVYRNESISKNLIGLNCVVTNNITSYKDDLEVLYFLSRINHESIVTKFSISTFPDILFTGDTGFEFIEKEDEIKLNKLSIVTAPHHGSKTSENEKGYNLIKGENIVFVRSESYRVVISDKFKRLPQKYCVKCNNESNTDKVVLTYSDKWYSSKKPCTCI